MTATASPARTTGRRRSTNWLTDRRCSCCRRSSSTRCSSCFPIVQAVYYSLFKWNGLKPLTDFVGLANYAARAGRPGVPGARSVHNALIVIVLSLLDPDPVRARPRPACSTAGSAGGRCFRLIFFAPYVLSEVITGIVFQLMLHAGRPGRSGARRRRPRRLRPAAGWRTRSIVLLTLFVIISWKYFGFHMILLLAGLQGIPRELEEAAAIDGASRRQAIRHITLPLLGPTIRVSVFLSIIGALQLFDLVWVTTGGGPVNASNTMATYMFDWGFRRYQLGLRQRGRGDPVRRRPRRRARLPALRAAARHRRRRDDDVRWVASPTSARRRRPARQHRAARRLRRGRTTRWAVLHRRSPWSIVVPFVFAVLGGFRTTARSATPGRRCRSVGPDELHRGPRRRRRSGGSSSTASLIAAITTLVVVSTASPSPRSPSRGWPSAAARRCTRCSRSACCSRWRSRSCRCTS